MLDIQGIIAYLRHNRGSRSGLFGRIVDYFKKEHTGYYTIDDERKLVRMYLQGDNELYQVVCSMGDIDSVHITVSQLMKIPPWKIAPACVLASLVNARTVARFTVDPNGDLAVSMSVSDRISRVDRQALKVAYLRTFQEAVTYYPAFYQLVNSDVIPEEAYSCLKSQEGDVTMQFKVPFIRVMPLEATS